MTIPKHALHLATLAVLLSLCVETNSKKPLGLLKNPNIAENRAKVNRETRSELDHWGRVERLERHGGNDGRIMESRQDDNPSAANAQLDIATAQQDNATAQQDATTVQGNATARQDICVDGRRKTYEEMLEEIKALTTEAYKTTRALQDPTRGKVVQAQLFGAVISGISGAVEAGRRRARDNKHSH